MPELNKCNECGKFKSWKDLNSASGDGADNGSYETWFECVDCTPTEGE